MSEKEEVKKNGGKVTTTWWELTFFVAFVLILGFAWGCSVGLDDGEEEGYEQGYNTGWMEADDRTIPTLEAVQDVIREKEFAMEQEAIVQIDLSDALNEVEELRRELSGRPLEVVVTATPVFHPKLLVFGGYILDGALATSFTDGVWIVGKDIEPGTYRNRDAALSSETDIWRTTLCKWTIYRGAGTIGWRTGYVTSESGELFNQVRLHYNRTFLSQYCGIWERIGD